MFAPATETEQGPPWTGPIVGSSLSFKSLSGSEDDCLLKYFLAFFLKKKKKIDCIVPGKSGLSFICQLFYLLHQEVSDLPLSDR